MHHPHHYFYIHPLFVLVVIDKIFSLPPIGLCRPRCPLSGRMPRILSLSILLIVLFDLSLSNGDMPFLFNSATSFANFLNTIIFWGGGGGGSLDDAVKRERRRERERVKVNVYIKEGDKQWEINLPLLLVSISFFSFPFLCLNLEWGVMLWREEERVCKMGIEIIS